MFSNNNTQRHCPIHLFNSTFLFYRWLLTKLPHMKQGPLLKIKIMDIWSLWFLSTVQIQSSGRAFPPPLLKSKSFGCCSFIEYRKVHILFLMLLIYFLGTLLMKHCSYSHQSNRYLFLWIHRYGLLVPAGFDVWAHWFNQNARFEHFPISFKLNRRRRWRRKKMRKKKNS